MFMVTGRNKIYIDVLVKMLDIIMLNDEKESTTSFSYEIIYF